MTIPRVSLLAGVAILTLLSACERPPKPAGEAMAAKVGEEIIGEDELNRAVARVGAEGEVETARARGKVLDALIDQHLVSAAARASKLDQTPEVAIALQQAQRQVLVEAYLERLFKNEVRPSDSEIQAYYDAYPELFAQRRLYQVQELDLQMKANRIGEVEAGLKQSKSLTEFADWLKAQGIQGKADGGIKPAEQVRGPVLAQLVRMQDGQVAVMPLGEDQVVVLQLQGSQSQPVTLAQAHDAIERRLLAEKRKALLEKEIKKLRAEGQVEYASGFKPGAAAGTAASLSPANAP